LRMISRKLGAGQSFSSPRLPGLGEFNFMVSPDRHLRHTTPARAIKSVSTARLPLVP
jgi:hypothetical protein